MMETPPQMATISQAFNRPGAKARIISMTIINAFPTIPAQAAALPKTLPLSMTTERTKPAASMRKSPTRRSFQQHGLPRRNQQRPLRIRGALEYWPLRESIAKARFSAR